MYNLIFQKMTMENSRRPHRLSLYVILRCLNQQLSQKCLDPNGIHDSQPFIHLTEKGFKQL